MSEQNDGADILNQQEEADLNTANEIDEQGADESVEEYKERLAKAEELANNYKIRAEKAERAAKASKTDAPSTGELSSKDLYALIEAKVPEDDIEDVREYAQMKKISIKDALASQVVKTILREKGEERKTAEVANTGSAKRSTGKVSDEALIERAQKGDLPQSEEDIMRLVKARKGIK